MNTKKIITTVLAVFVLCAVLCGTVSAFEVTSPGKTDPSGAVVPNETISGYMQILIKHDTLTDGDKIYFESDLINPSWSVSVGTQGGVPLLTKTPQAPVNYITGYDVSYGDSDIVVDVNVTGTVFSGSAGTEITAMTVRATASETTGVKSASSPVQKVYDPSSISSEISALNTSIQNLDSRIAVYLGYGWDVSKAQSALEQARSKVRDAQNISDPKAAYVAIDTAKNQVKNAERELALASLSMSLSYTTYVDAIVQELYQKGWNSEGMLLDTKNTNLQTTYNQLNATYMAGNSPNGQELDKLAADSLALYNEALVYQESSNNPLGGILGFLPFILIGLGAAAIIVVVVVVIIKKRKNSWDELG